MKNFLLLLCTSFLLFACGSSKPAAGTESYVRPGYAKKKYKQILVLGTMKDVVGRKKTESALTDLLNRSGYHGLASNAYFDLEGISHIDTLKARMAPLDFDAVIVLQYLGQSSTITDKVTVSPTTPLVTGSFFDFYTSPAYDFSYESQSQRAGYVNASFYTRENYQKEWNSIVQVNFSNGLEMASELLAGATLSRLVRDKIL